MLHRVKDNNINLLEFRINVKKLELEGVTMKHIDSLFESLDLDGGGSLDIRELNAAFVGLKEAARDAIERGDLGRRHATDLRVVCEVYEEADKATSAFEVTEADLQYARESQSTGSRLGALLKTRNLKIGDVVRAWDRDGTGSVDMKEFRHHVKALGFKAKDDELDAVFLELDDDGSGALDLDELKTALKKLQDSAAAWVANDAKATNGVVAAKKAARTAQYAAQKAEAEAEAKLEAAEMAAAQARADAKAASFKKHKMEREAQQKKKEELRQKQHQTSMASIRQDYM